MRWVPLAMKMRPKELSGVIGQHNLVGQDGFITRQIQKNKPLSILLWGPPGCGKTTIAKLYAKAFSCHYITLSALDTTVSDIRKIVKEHQHQPLLSPYTLLFMDEIHRFNKAQQDAFLPFVEEGRLVLIGATTENPSYHINDSLLSRLHTRTLKALSENELEQLLCNFEEEYTDLPLTVEARALLIEMAQGDGRYLLNLIEALPSQERTDLLDVHSLKQLLHTKVARYDRKSDQHYHLISALHKSIRGSDPEAALYWLNRMLEGGEDPLYIGRRLIRIAIEDIGLADDRALSVCLNAYKAYQILGSPEGELGFSEAVIYLTLSPKSNAVYKAHKQARDLAQKTTHLSPPKHLLNAATSLMKNMDYGRDYQYEHDHPLGLSSQEFFPKGLENTKLYHPVKRGFERELFKRQQYFKSTRDKLKKTPA